MRLLALIIFYFGIIISATASDQEGYIINNTGDTLRGMIDVELKKVAGKKELDLGEMEHTIQFTEAGAKAKKMRAGDIAGYGFLYENTWYHFEVLDMPKNAWKKNQGMGERKINNLRLFIHRAYEGALLIYKDYFKYMAGMMAKPTINLTRSTPYGVELFIKNPDLGFVEVSPEKPGDSKKLKDFLMKYLSLEEEFLKTVDDKTKFSEAEEILKAYNEWKKKNA